MNSREHKEQVALFQWAEHKRELKWMFSIPNGAAFGSDSRTRMIRGRIMKAEGLKSGVSDIFIPYPAGGYHGMFIEMKAPKTADYAKGTASKEQKEFIRNMNEQGYYAVLAYGCDAAIEMINQYLKGEA